MNSESKNSEAQDRIRPTIAVHTDCPKRTIVVEVHDGILTDVFIPEELAFQIETFRDLASRTQKHADTPASIHSEALFAEIKGDITDVINR